MTNSEIAATFRRLADLLDLRGENPFKIRSYRTAADTIEDTPTPLADMLSAGGVASLKELPGIGDAISRKIADLLATGTFKLYEEVKADIPESTLDLLRVEGIGIGTLKVLHGRFRLTNLDDFAKFVGGGGLDSVPGLGEKSQARIRRSLQGLGYSLVAGPSSSCPAARIPLD
jgi:DNA polymerase (family 10)